MRSKAAKFCGWMNLLKTYLKKKDYKNKIKIYSNINVKHLTNDNLKQDIFNTIVAEKIIKPKHIFVKFKLARILKKTFKYKYSHILNIKLKNNNIFCTASTRKHWTILNKTSGSYKLRVTKKDLKYSNKKIIHKSVKKF